MATAASSGLLAAAAAVLALVPALGGCYRPNVTDNGFLCAKTGKPCPDGFQCGADQRCSVSPVTVVPDAAQTQDTAMETSMMMSDAGSDSTCRTPVTPACATGPAAGDVCSPSCQTGCGACTRCNVVSGRPACVAVGTVGLGDVCTPGATDNCGAGLICLIETCGNGLARCYKHCTANSQCDNMACTIGIDDGSGMPSNYKTCDVPARACDPVANSGCPDPALVCYLTSANDTLCDCPTRPAAMGLENAECTIYSECAPGYICIKGVDGQTTPHCHFVCNVATPSCPNNKTCVPAGTGAKYGFCNTPM